MYNLVLGRKHCRWGVFSCSAQILMVLVTISGNALLSVGMISPSGHGEAELSMKKTTNTTYTLTYTCKEQGEHVLSIKFGDEDIPGSPFNIHT